MKTKEYLCQREYLGSQLMGSKQLGTIHKHLLGGPNAKMGALKILDPCKEALKKITTNFPVKIEFTCFSMGLTCNFHGKRRGV